MHPLYLASLYIISLTFLHYDVQFHSFLLLISNHKTNRQQSSVIEYENIENKIVKVILIIIFICFSFTSLFLKNVREVKKNTLIVIACVFNFLQIASFHQETHRNFRRETDLAYLKSRVSQKFPLSQCLFPALVKNSLSYSTVHCNRRYPRLCFSLSLCDNRLSGTLAGKKRGFSHLSSEIGGSYWWLEVLKWRGSFLNVRDASSRSNKWVLPSACITNAWCKLSHTLYFRNIKCIL